MSLLFEPHSYLTYRPLFSWAGSYFAHLQVPALPSVALNRAAAVAPPLHLRAQRDTTGVADAWVETAFVPVAPPVCVAMLDDPTKSAQADGLQPLRGPFVYGLPQWRALTVKVSVHVMRNEPLPSRLVRLYGNKLKAGDAWLHDNQVRGQYDIVHTAWCSVLVSATGNAIVELPHAWDVSPPALRMAVLYRLRDGAQLLLRHAFEDATWAGASAHTLVDRREKHSGIHAMLEQDVDLVACRTGAITAHKADKRSPRDPGALVIDRQLGERGAHVLALGRSAQTVVGMRTHVRGPEVQGLFWLRPEPPHGAHVRTFNERVVRFPHRLFSYEVRRVETTLQTLERLPGPTIIAMQKTLDTNVVLTAAYNKRYYCIDAITECFAPVPHIWR